MHAQGSSFLSQFRFSGSVDFVTIATPGKLPLRRLIGDPKWGAAAHYQQLTVHNLAASDVQALAADFPRARVLGLEVAVDLRPNRDVATGDRAALLDQAHGFMVRHLYPYRAPYMRDAKTLAYVPEEGKTVPFNLKVPQPSAQLLYGLRNDGLAQVKVYRKERDDGVDLPERLHSTRVEVSLKRGACEALGILVIEDLAGFTFRTKLAPYFRMVRSGVPVKQRTQRAVLALVEDRKAGNAQDLVEDAWSDAGTGVQALLGVPGIRFTRHIEANQRIGTALQLLQRRFAACAGLDTTGVESVSQDQEAEEVADWIEGERITIKDSTSSSPTDTDGKDPIAALEELV